MPKQISQIRVFVSCPGDVEEEKEIVRRVCSQLSDDWGESKGILLKVIDWKRDIVPLITGADAQTVIDNQLKEYDYDIYIGILWRRFGDRRTSDLTPTEGEFTGAFHRKQETGRPVIQFYFKLDEYYPTGTNEAQQALEVQKFKGKFREQQLGLFCEFRGKHDFRNKVKNSLKYIVDNFSKLTAKETGIPKKKYPTPLDYIPRMVYPMKDFTSIDIMFLREERSRDIVSVINEEKRVVLVGDAGVGKSTELKRVASELSKDTLKLYPFLVPLNQYVNQRLEELLPSEWKQVPESQLIVILDGLDEVESKNRYDGIRQIELFAEQHPDAHILLSCRTNFYQTETNETPGSLAGFKTYVLLNLDDEQVEDYVKTKL